VDEWWRDRADGKTESRLADLVVGTLVPAERVALQLVGIERALLELELLVPMVVVDVVLVTLVATAVPTDAAALVEEEEAHEPTLHGRSHF
jgi:hypothetical protein